MELTEQPVTLAPKSPTAGLWQKSRSGVMFVVACIASPCGAPLIVSVLLALLAGTPAAAWITAHLGWVYGGLTLVSIASLVIALRWFGRRKASQRASQPISLRPSDSPIFSLGDKTHVE